MSLPKELTESGPLTHLESGHLSAKTRSARLCQGSELEKTQGRHPPPPPPATGHGAGCAEPAEPGWFYRGDVCARQAPGSRTLVVTVASLADNPRHSLAVPNSSSLPFLRGFPLLLWGPPVIVRAPLKLAVIYPKSHSVYLGLAERSQISSQLSRGTQRYSSQVLHVPSTALQAQNGAALVSLGG